MLLFLLYIRKQFEDDFSSKSTITSFKSIIILQARWVSKSIGHTWWCNAWRHVNLHFANAFHIFHCSLFDLRSCQKPARPPIALSLQLLWNFYISTYRATIKSLCDSALSQETDVKWLALSQPCFVLRTRVPMEHLFLIFLFLAICSSSSFLP